MITLKGKTLPEYAKGAIEHLEKKLENATSDIRRERLSDRREYWLKQLEKERKENGNGKEEAKS